MKYNGDLLDKGLLKCNRYDAPGNSYEDTINKPFFAVGQTLSLEHIVLVVKEY